MAVENFEVDEVRVSRRKRTIRGPAAFVNRKILCFCWTVERRLCSRSERDCVSPFERFGGGQSTGWYPKTNASSGGIEGVSVTLGGSWSLPDDAVSLFRTQLCARSLTDRPVSV